MKLKYIILGVLVVFILIIYPFFKGFVSALAPRCCDYEIILNINHDKFKEQYSSYLNGKVELNEGDIILIYGTYYLVEHGSIENDSTKSYVSIKGYCYNLWGDIHNDQNYCTIPGIYYWNKKYKIWKVKFFFRENMIEYKTNDW